MITDNEGRGKIRAMYYSAKKRLDIFGEEFNYDGLFDVDGKTAVDGSSRKLKLMVFWSPGSRVSIELIRQIDRLKDEFNARRVKVIAVCKTQDAATREQLREISAENQSIEFCQLKTDDRSSDQFIARFPVRKYPYLLMLSADNQVVGINVDPVFFEPVGR